MGTDHDVLIAGGGLNGPALGLALAGAGLSVAVIDARPATARAQPDFDGRAYALNIGSKRLLEGIGLWPALAPLAEPILRILAEDGRPGEAPSHLRLEFDAAEIEEGPMGFMVEDRDLYRAFLEAMGRAGRLHHLPGTGIVDQAVGPGSVEVTLADGRRLTGRVLAGCDGRASGTARRAGIGRTGWGYGQTALVTALSHEVPHGGTARQIFLPGGPLAILPLRGNRSAIVWSEADAAAMAIAALDDGAFLALLGERLGGVLGQIGLSGGRFTHPLGLSLADRYAAPRVALVGDAAHGVHPVAGQGLNLGLRDVGALAQVLTDAHRRGEDIGAIDVLRRYERWRRFDATALALGMDAVTRLFSNDSTLLRAARDLGMGAVGRMPGLRRAFIRQAAGLTGELPRLNAGQPL
ncbi:MAG: UbiH/UbiF/VisC/COQ6 family ubiquinone biosynthesis hydroxylase [Rhodobacteraceae bacterium]|nr:UbiH/UbiF/VisC/COQ6 family ubiquinone biosynthesis hydroxylase [Paracoccaceae bacterium]